MAGLVTDFCASGLAAARPAVPSAPSTVLCFYFAYDTEVLSHYDWNDAAWQNVGTSSTPAVQSVVSAATVTPTFSDDQVNVTAQAVALALVNPTGTAVDAWGIAVRIKDNGAARAITYGTQYRALGVTLPATTVVSKTLYLGMIFNAADTKWDVVAVAQEV